METDVESVWKECGKLCGKRLERVFKEYSKENTKSLRKRIIKNSRKSNPDGKYQVPDRFLYRFISCPNYFSESVQWLGWAIMVMGLPAWLFFFWTVANLLPRAISHHRWYKENASGYPKAKKAFLPFIL